LRDGSSKTSRELISKVSSTGKRAALGSRGSRSKSRGLMDISIIDRGRDRDDSRGSRDQAKVSSKVVKVDLSQTKAFGQSF